MNQKKVKIPEWQALAQLGLLIKTEDCGVKPKEVNPKELKPKELIKNE